MRMKNAKLRKRGGWIFLAVVVGIYIFLGFTNHLLFESSFLTFIRILWGILPVLILIFLMMFVVNVFLDEEKTMKYLGRTSGLKGWIFAILGGVLSTGPVYMWYPLLRDLKAKGMKNSLVATFLYNRAVKIPLLPLMIYYFGWVFTVVLTVYMIAFSVIAGVFVGMILQYSERRF